MPNLLNSDDLIFPFDEYKYSDQAFAVSETYYYEWNEKEHQWSKLTETDPEPPELPPGQFDGQIIEVPKI